MLCVEGDFDERGVRVIFWLKEDVLKGVIFDKGRVKNCSKKIRGCKIF